MVKKEILVIICIYGLSLGISFLSPYANWVSIVSMTPIFYLNSKLPFNRRNNFIFAFSVYLGTIIWHVLATGWLYGAFILGPLLIHIINPIFISLIWILYRWVNNSASKAFSYLIFIVSWISFEYIQLNWELSFTLLSLGNVFGSIPELCQWYSYTGVLGGSVWILVANIFAFEFFNEINAKRSIILALWILCPLIVSNVLYINYEESNDEMVPILLIHPNLDCRTERKTLTDNKKLQHYKRLIASASSVQFILAPENSFFEPTLVENLNVSQLTKDILSTMCVSSITSFVSGCVLGEICLDSTQARKRGRYFQRVDNSTLVFTYNGVVNYNSINELEYRTKKKLVPVEEFIPYPHVLGLIRKMIPSLGGFSFTYSTHDNEIMKFNDIKFVPLICYESTFGEYTASLTRKGAEVIFLILNEGWYKNIIGANMFQNISRLRAIETRRYIARASNDGITSIINQRGDIVNSTESFKPGVLLGHFRPNEKITFYSKYGDWIGKLSILFLPILGLYLLYLKVKVKKS